jgi:hypothetical protein
MSILSRLKYAMCVLIAITMVLMLTLAIGEGIGIAQGFDIPGLMRNPFYFAPVFLVGFIVAPALSGRVPVSGDSPSPEKDGKRSHGYTARTLLLVIGGLVLAMLANLAVFILGKLA